MFAHLARLSLLLTLTTVFGSAQQNNKDSLQFTLRQASPGSAFQGSLNNTGDHFLIINPGFLTGDNILRLPEWVQLSFIDSEGNTTHLEGKKLKGIMGALGRNLVYLPAHGTFTFQFELQDFTATLKPGIYEMQAVYFGLPDHLISSPNSSGRPGAKVPVPDVDRNSIYLDPSTPIWDGRVTSNSISVKIP